MQQDEQTTLIREDRYDTQRMYEDAFPLGTIFIASNTDVRGAANLYPVIESCSAFDPTTAVA